MEKQMAGRVETRLSPGWLAITDARLRRDGLLVAVTELENARQFTRLDAAAAAVVTDRRGVVLECSPVKTLGVAGKAEGGWAKEAWMHQFSHRVIREAAGLGILH